MVPFRPPFELLGVLRPGGGGGGVVVVVVVGLCLPGGCGRPLPPLPPFEPLAGAGAGLPFEPELDPLLAGGGLLPLAALSDTSEPQGADTALGQLQTLFDSSKTVSSGHRNSYTV